MSATVLLLLNTDTALCHNDDLNGNPVCVKSLAYAFYVFIHTRLCVSLYIKKYYFSKDLKCAELFIFGKVET